jgi:transcriptional regulator with XRE-family HTH domain
VTTAPASAVDIALVRKLAADGTARRIREASGLSMADIASDLGTSVSTVSMWERGIKSPRSEIALRYGELLDRLVDQLGES